MGSPKQSPTLRRYTTLPALLHLLQNRRITLLSPATWDDRNDAFFMSQYKRRGNLKTVLALCFTEADETYHHWRVFAHGSEGVCIAFRREALLANFANITGVRTRKVTYKRIKDLKTFHPQISSLPFLKRQPYSDEKEFRIVYSSSAEEVEAKGFPIGLDCIRRVTLSPWMPAVLGHAVKTAIRRQPGCGAFELYQTTLLENERWKRAALQSTTSRRTATVRAGELR